MPEPDRWVARVDSQWRIQHCGKGAIIFFLCPFLPPHPFPSALKQGSRMIRFVLKPDFWVQWSSW